MSDQLTSLAELADQAPNALSTLESAETWIKEVMTHADRRRGQFTNFKEQTNLVTGAIEDAIPNLLRLDDNFLPKLREFISKDRLSDTFRSRVEEEDYDGFATTLLSSSNDWVEAAASPTIQAIIKVRKSLKETASIDSAPLHLFENSL